MSSHELYAAISAAIGSHGLWKAQLRAAIKEGSHEMTPEQAGANNLCEFGQFLVHLDSQTKSTSLYREVFQLHSDFHKEAMAILFLAQAGKRAEAEKAMDTSSKFIEVSSKLTATMKAWQQS